MRKLAFLCMLVAMLPALAQTAIEKLDPNMASKDPEGKWLWYDARQLTVEGQGWTDTAAPYDRFPAKAEGVVREAVWNLSRHSAGICVRFSSNADKISARWKVTAANLAMPHMPATGVSGLDLYIKADGKWQWIGAGRPEKQESDCVLASGIPAGEHEYLCYLPLYNGTDKLEIGVPPDAALAKAGARPAGHDKPIVFYGTSITHGGCASRPGMAHPAILGRRLDTPVINLGFSGNGTMDPEVGALLAELDAAVYVIDCAPNMSPEVITERAEPFVTALRAAKPDVPIVLVECVAYQAGAVLPEKKAAYMNKNKALREAYDRLVAKGVPNMSYIEGPALLGDDGDATVDGTHPTDLGFQRIADAMEPVLRKALTGGTASALETDPAGWVDIMPAADLKGWTRVPVPPGDPLGRPQWHVEEGGKVLVCDGDGGHDMLLTEREFGDVIFHFEFRYTKIEGKAGYNSGAYVRNSADGAIWHQAQFGDGFGGYLFGETPDGNGGKKFFSLDKEIKNGRVKPAGEWNTMEITARGNVLTLWANGGVTCAFTACGAPKGRVGVEGEGFRIEFRNLKVKEL